MTTTWIIVADSSRARIFAMDDATRDLREIEDLANPQGRRLHQKHLSAG